MLTHSKFLLSQNVLITSVSSSPAIVLEKAPIDGVGK